MSETGIRPLYIHATAIAVDGHGILISGPSKAGKSTLSEALMALARQAGHKAEFIGDDRIGLLAGPDGLEIRPHPAIAGLIERRGSGIHPIAHRPTAIARLEIALDGEAGMPVQTFRVERLPGIWLDGWRSEPCPAGSVLFPLVLAALPQ